MGFFETILAGLIVAAISGATGHAYGRRKEKQLIQRRHEAAVKQFAHDLKTLIANANPDGPDAMRDARSIVSTRDSVLQWLTSAASALNSDIDRLKELMGDGLAPQSNQAEIRERLHVLKRTWPTKETQLNVAIRRILTELGYGEG